MEARAPKTSLEPNPLILRRVGNVLLNNDVYAERYLPPSMHEAFGMLAYNDTVDSQQVMHQLGLETLADVDSRSFVVAEYLWPKVQETVEPTEETHAISAAIEKAAADFTVRPEAQRLPLPESIPEPLSSSRAAWRTETLRRIHHLLVNHGISPQRLLINNILCRSAYPYFVGGVHIPKAQNFIRQLQDETIQYLSELVPEVLGFALQSDDQGYNPYPSPIDPARLPWRKGERREIIPFIHRQLAGTETPPRSVVPAGLMDLYTMAATTPKSTTVLGEESGDGRRIVSRQIGRIVDEVIDRVPADKLQLRRLREMASYVLLGVAASPAQTGTRAAAKSEMAEVSADTPWRRGEQLEVVRQFYGLLEARGHDPTEALHSNILGWYYRKVVETDTPFTVFVTEHGLDRTRARKNLIAIIEKFSSIFPPETLALTERRREARINLQARHRAQSWQRHSLPTVPVATDSSESH